MKRLLFGRSGLTRDELHPLHRWSRLIYTFCNVKFSGESWREYKAEWLR